MDDLFIWFNRTKVPDGYPLTDEIIIKDTFDKARPKYTPDQRWKLFNPYKMDFPPSEEYKFPDKLYMVITKSCKTIIFDYYSHQISLDGILDYLFTGVRGFEYNMSQAIINVIDVQLQDRNIDILSKEGFDDDAMQKEITAQFSMIELLRTTSKIDSSYKNKFREK